MKLNELFSDNTLPMIEVSSLACSTQAVMDGSVFFCLVGNLDGHNYAMDAVNGGAIALVVERKLDIDIPQIIVQSTRIAMSRAAATFYGNPADRLTMIAITGTNGKTTTSYIVRSILNAANKNVGIIGTNAIEYAGKRLCSKLTTPDPIDLHSTLADMLSHGVKYVVMEASAHALALDKLYGIHFAAIGFTNLTQDHLDFFGNMNDYGLAKAKLFQSGADYAVINVDDAFGRQLMDKSVGKVYTYGIDNPADYFAIDANIGVGGIEYTGNFLDEVIKIRFSLSGRYNVYNTLCAAGLCKCLGISVGDIARGIRNLTKVDGRFNIISTDKCSIIIDFAHTEDGLANILRSIREFAGGKIITVFGCGGERDSGKRPCMGRTAAKLSDRVIITSDNPRGEDADKIIDEIASGISEDYDFIRIADRRAAIYTAIESAQAGDVVLVAGKGAEQYQEICGVKYPYSDEQYILSLIEENLI